jgi:hypothetical protein
MEDEIDSSRRAVRRVMWQDVHRLKRYPETTMPRATNRFIHVLLIGLMAIGAVGEATTPPRPLPVPPEMLSGVTLRLPVRNKVVLIDAPGPEWTWHRVGERNYSCDLLDTQARVLQHKHSLRFFVVDRVPSRTEAQTAFDRQATARGERNVIESWDYSDTPVSGTIRYTMVHTIITSSRYVGYYTPEGIHLIGSDDDDERSALFARFVASYRIQ